jgi:hypothetical protein
VSGVRIHDTGGGGAQTRLKSKHDRKRKGRTDRTDKKDKTDKTGQIKGGKHCKARTSLKCGMSVMAVKDSPGWWQLQQ